MATRFAAILTVIAILLATPLWQTPKEVQALDYTLIETKLNTWQYYFCRTLMSVSLKDYYDTGVLPSITAGQAYYEGGGAGYPISVIAQNHFGIKMHSGWEGKVFDHGEDVVYNSYADLVNIKGKEYAQKASLWRAYDTLEESVADHSAFLHTYERYEIVLAAKDYKEAAEALMTSGYCSESTYPSTLIKFIETYGFDQLDTVTADEYGVFGMIMDRARVDLTIGETTTLTAAAYPAPEIPVDVYWESTDTNVVTVDQDGNLTAVGQGFALITATYNGKEACAMVVVDCNAHIMSSSAVVRTQPSASGDSLGKLQRGQPFKINSDTLYTDEDGNEYYAITTRVNGLPVSGYLLNSDIAPDLDARLSVGTPTTVFRVQIGEEFTIPLEIYAEELMDKIPVWRSANSAVATVSPDGTVTPVADGVVTISALFDGTAALTVTVYVGNADYEVITATANVYLRESPKSGSTILGLIRTGDQVKLILEPESGWYYVLAVIDGVPMEGYSYSRYFHRPGDEIPPEDPEDPSEPEDPPEPDYNTPPPYTIVTMIGEVQVDDSLNVRSTAGTKGTKIAKLKNKDRVTILDDSIYLEEEPTYKEWYQIQFVQDGKTLVGYVSAEFVEIVGTSETVVANPAPLLSHRYKVEELFVAEIPAGTTLETFAAESSYEIRAFRADGTQLAPEDVLHTGDEIHFMVENTIVATRTIAIMGDVNGNGKVDTGDYVMIKRIVLKTLTADAAAYRAAAVTNGTSVNAADYVKLKRVVMGTYQFPS